MKKNSQIYHSDVPKKYQGLPSAMVALLWHEPHHRDQEKNTEESALREKALAALRGQEWSDEIDREKAFDKIITSITNSDKKKWSMIEGIIKARIAGHIQGETTLERAVSPNEQALLARLSLEYETKLDKKKNKKNAIVSRTVATIKISDQFDALVFRNLVKGLTIDAWNTLNDLYQIIGVKAVDALKESTQQLSATPSIRIALVVGDK